MNAIELREKSLEELDIVLIEQLKDQFALRMQRSAGQLERPSEMKKVRRTIARIKTIKNEMKAKAAGNKS